MERKRINTTEKKDERERERASGMREKEECVNVRRTTRVTLQTQGEKKTEHYGA